MKEVTQLRFTFFCVRMSEDTKNLMMRLRMRESIFTVANMSGTSVGHIESHYGHIDEQMKIDAALKHTKINRTGIGEKQSYDCM